MYHHVVEGRRPLEGVAVAFDARLEQEAFVHGVLAGKHGADLVLDLFRRDVREEAEAAAVDAQHQYAAVGQVARHPENAAVAADNDDEVALAAQVGPRRRGVPPPRKHARRVRLQDHLHAGPHEDILHRHDRVDDMGTARPAHEAHGCESLFVRVRHPACAIAPQVANIGPVGCPSQPWMRKLERTDHPLVAPAV